jgi:hypothetical protein
MRIVWWLIGGLSAVSATVAISLLAVGQRQLDVPDWKRAVSEGHFVRLREEPAVTAPLRRPTLIPVRQAKQEFVIPPPPQESKLPAPVFSATESP